MIDRTNVKSVEQDSFKRSFCEIINVLIMKVIEISTPILEKINYYYDDDYEEYVKL